MTDAAKVRELADSLAVFMKMWIFPERFNQHIVALRAYADSLSSANSGQAVAWRIQLDSGRFTSWIDTDGNIDSLERLRKAGQVIEYAYTHPASSAPQEADAMDARPWCFAPDMRDNSGSWRIYPSAGNFADSAVIALVPNCDVAKQICEAHNSAIAAARED